MAFKRPNTVQRNPGNPGPRSLNKTDVFRAEVENSKPVDEDADLMDLNVGARSGDFDEARVWRSSLPSIVMYKPTDNPASYARRIVPAANMRMNFANGWLAFCPDCGEECGDDPNNCPAREPSKYRQCPVCANVIRDTGDQNISKSFKVNDPNMIANDNLEGSTPEARTLNKLCDHMLAYHPKESRSYPFVMEYLSGSKLNTTRPDTMMETSRMPASPATLPADTTMVED